LVNVEAFTGIETADDAVPGAGAGDGDGAGAGAGDGVVDGDE